MKRSDKWFFGLILIYMIVGFSNLYFKFIAMEFLQMGWLFMLGLPLWFKPLAKRLNMYTIWE